MKRPDPDQRETPVTPVPAKAGIGLKFEHIGEILVTKPQVGWLEVHAENYMGDGGKPVELLEEIARQHPVSVHGVGLSIGGAEDLDEAHLRRLKRLVEMSGRGSIPNISPGARSEETISPTCCHCPTRGRRSTSSAPMSTRCSNISVGGS